MAQKETWKQQNVPLSLGEQALYASGMILPSGESNFFDFRQQGKDISTLEDGEPLKIIVGLPEPSGRDGFPSANVPLYGGCVDREHGLELHFKESGTFDTSMSNLLAPISSGIKDSALAPKGLITPFSEHGHSVEGIPLK